jgi:pimeloyl-ACP methyl ester carboxylesterase
VTVHVHDEGSGPAVLLLHGQPGLGDDWEPVAARLRTDHRVLVPDRPGYGRTSLAARGLEANAAAIAEVLDDRGVDRVTVAGHSWGGGVALALALRDPDRVHALVLAASIGAPSSIDPIDRILAVPVVGDALAFTGLRWLPRLLTVPQVRSVVAPVTGRLPAAELHARAAHWRASWRSFAIEQRAMVAEVPQLATRLGEVTAPAVVLAGAADRMLPRKAAPDLAQRLPNARLVRVPGAGHMLPLEAADVVAAEIRALAASLAS